VTFSEVLRFAENGLIFTFRRGVISALLCLLGGSEVSLNSVIRRTA
jgi:hypothetical protein